MPSDKGEVVQGDPLAASRRRQRACDMCRRRKRRCDGEMRCTHCVRYGFDCTYDKPAPVRIAQDIKIYDPDLAHSSTIYAVELKQKIDAAETELKTIHEHTRETTPSYVRAIRRLMQPLVPPHPDDTGHVDLAESFKALSLGGAPPLDPGFQGKSSAAMLVKAAVAVRPTSAQAGDRYYIPHAPKPWTQKPREQYSTAPAPHMVFPDDGVMRTLVARYFSFFNEFIPILHRGVFEQSMRDKVHLHHGGFARTLMLVCALGALYEHDGALGTDATASETRSDGHATAWRFYNQVELCGQFLRQQASLYDLQSYCLAAAFLYLTSHTRTAWIVTGFGLKIAQDLGIHRYKFDTPGPQGVLEDRALWILVFFDTILSGVLGREAQLAPVELDTAMPAPGADEDPFAVQFFTLLLGLYKIQQFALRVLYMTQPSIIRRGITDMLSVSKELDATLDGWERDIPDRLKWETFQNEPLDAHMDSARKRLYNQSAVLHCFCYHTRMTIHRSFMRSTCVSEQEPDVEASTHAVTAARDCISLVETYHRRRPHTYTMRYLLFSQEAVFTAAMILVLNRWEGTPTTHLEDENLEPVRAALGILKEYAEIFGWEESDMYFIPVLERMLQVDADRGQGTSKSMRNDMPPVFVGDEEIRPSAARLRRTRFIPFDLGMLYK